MEGAGAWAKRIIDMVPVYCKRYIRGEITIRGDFTTFLSRNRQLKIAPMHGIKFSAVATLLVERERPKKIAICAFHQSMCIILESR